MPIWKVIGISGVTCGGKTSLAEMLLKKYHDSIHINQDDFFRTETDPNHEWVDVNASVRHQNWESMASVDWEAFTDQIRQSLDKEKPSHSSLLIIEGHLIFNYKPISDLCDKKFFITLSKEECFRRRTARQYLPQDPNGYFDAWVWPMYLTNMDIMISMNQGNQIVFLDGSVNQKGNFESIIDKVAN